MRYPIENVTRVSYEQRLNVLVFRIQIRNMDTFDSSAQHGKPIPYFRLGINTSKSATHSVEK